MEIRELADREDAREMAVAHGRAWRAAYDDILPEAVIAGVPVHLDGADLDEYYDHYADRDGVFVADVEGTVRGYVFVRWGEETKEFVGTDEAGLKEIYVHPDYWGAGLGTALLERGLAAIPERCTALVLETFAENDVARAFYEARGFERTGTVDTGIAGETYESAIYRREL